MKKSTILYLLAVVVLGIAVYILLQKDRSGTIPNVLKDFAVKDTQNITKIILKDRSGITAVLEKTPDGKWTINKKYPAFKERIDLLLECIKSLEVKNPVPAPSRDNYIRDMSAKGIKISIYKKGNADPDKSYTVGGETADELGTIMLLKGSSEPFVMHIPGFNGYLSIRYFTAEQDWRSLMAYDVSPILISQIKIDYPEKKDESFTLNVEGGNIYVENNSGKKIKPDMLKAKSCILGFSHLDFENFITPKIINFDSTLSSAPYAVISIKAKGAELPALKLFRKRYSGQTKFIEDKIWDGDRYLSNLSSSPKELFTIQRFVLDKIPQKFSDFAAK